MSGDCVAEIAKLCGKPLSQVHREFATELAGSVDRLYDNPEDIEFVSHWCTNEAMPLLSKMMTKAMPTGRLASQKSTSPTMRAMILWYTNKIEKAPGDLLKGHSIVLWDGAGVSLDLLDKKSQFNGMCACGSRRNAHV